jgi:hypothetical protein
MPFDDVTILTYREQPADPVLQLLVDGLAYIRKNGWIRISTEEMLQAQYVLTHILNAEEEARAEECRKALESEYGEEWEDYWDDHDDPEEWSVEGWNDKEGREQSEVEALFERAIALRQQEGEK